MEGTSLWLDTAQQARYPALAADRRADVCVIGAGIAGVTIAYSRFDRFGRVLNGLRAPTAMPQITRRQPQLS